MKVFITKYRQPLFVALIGIIAGILPSILNHLGEFWKWGVLAKTASNYGFWIIFVVLIIMKSKSRKFAALNVFLFCFIMCIVYGVVETIYKMPLHLSGDLSTDNIFGNNLLGLFFEYEFAQAHWFALVALLIPISLIIFDFLYKKVKIFTKITVNVLILAPLMLAIATILARIVSPVIVCADISNGWTPDICSLQSPDAWIVVNLAIEVVLYAAFSVFWIFYCKPQAKIRARKQG
ncbi:hypothetical protein FWF93_00180 [Candidatus Saccharibacteria bacterium]|nr:hypothetical protein [Candidatus Saccharibacteria bacterium]